jgi:hypothetical protein
MLVLSIGFGLILSAEFFFGPRLPPAKLFLYVLGISVEIIGIWLYFRKNREWKREIKKQIIETKLNEGEEILKVFAGGRRITKFKGSIGKWCLTNQRLIYEGSPPTISDSEPETLIFSMENFEGAEIIKRSMFDKYLEVRFVTETNEETVQIWVKKLEELKELLQKSKS